MGFRSSIAPAAPVSAAPAPSSVEGVLQPDPVRSAELEARGPDAQRAAGAAAHVQALRTMNAVRTLVPLLATATAGGGDDRQQATRFSSLLGRATKLASDTLSALNYDPTLERNRWMVNVLERGYAEVVAAGDVPDTVAQEVAAGLAARACELPENVDLGQDATLALSMVQAMLPIVLAQQQFDFFRDRTQDLNQARDLLLEEVVKTMETLAPPMAGVSERGTMLGLLCQEAGKALGQAWEWGAAQAREALSRKTKAEITAWRAANPSGFPIAPVHARFRETMHRIRILARPPAR